MRSGRAPGVGTKTVLFSDVVASTQMRVSLGEHHADSLDDELRRIHEVAVESNEGELVKGLGDGWMAAFDSAANAIAAAIEMQTRLRDRNRRRDVEVGLRVGLSTGDVTITEDDYLGTPVVEAARLCSEAASGEILVAEVVRLLAGSRAGGQLRDRGMLDLKGLSAPVQAWQVVWDMVMAPPPLMPPGLAVNDDFGFVGRSREQERIDAAWRRASDGQMTALLLSGEPGAGKTRLTAEFATRAQAGGAVLLYGACEDGLGVPYQPFVEALRQHLAAVPRAPLGSHPEELARLVPEIAQRTAGLPAPVSSDPDTERYQLFNAVVDWITDVGADEPVVFVIDDLHWATKPTLQLLRHIVRSKAQAPVLLMATFRDTEIDTDHPLSEALADLQRSDNVERIPLAGLDVDAIREYLGQLAGHELEPWADRLAERLHTETNGNPFFVREVLLHLAEDGHLRRQDDRWTAGEGLVTAVPIRARDVITQRLARLPEQARSLLSRAAVVGIDFRLPVLMHVTGLDEDDVFDGLEQAMAARLVEEVELDRYRFTHALVRAALLDGLSASRKARIHRQVAETLERDAVAQLDLVEELAEHWSAAGNAGDAAKALTYTRLAAQRASEQFAYDEAVGLLRRAFDLARVRGMSELEEAELLADLGAAQQRAGDPEHRATLLEVGRMARRLGSTDVLVRSVLDNARTAAVLDVDDERVDLLESALEATAGTDRPERARLLANLSFELSFTHDQERVVQLSNEALRLAEARGSLSDLAYVLSMRVTAFRSPDTLAERLEVCTWIEKVSVELDDPGLRFHAAFRRAEVLIDAGDIDGFRAVVETMEQLTSRLRQPMMLWNTSRRIAERELLAGRLDEALENAERVRTLGHELLLPYSDPIYVCLTTKIFEAQGRFEEAAALWEPWVDRIHLIGFRFGFAHALAQAGRIDEAGAQWERGATGEFGDVHRDLAWLETMALAADVSLFLGDTRRGRKLHDMLAPYAGHIITSGVGAVCTAEHAIGVAALAAGDVDEAIAQFATALQVADSIRAPLLRGMTLVRSGAARVARRAPGDAELAQQQVEEALAIARAFRAPGVGAGAEAVLGT